MAIKKAAAPEKKQDQRMVALHPSVKVQLDENLNRANALREKVRLSRLTRSDFISIMLKKVTDKDCKSTDF